MNVILRKESQGENQTHSNCQKSDTKSSKTRLEKVVLSTVLGLSVGLCLKYVDKREREVVWVALIYTKSHMPT